MKKILITGGLGYIGSHTVVELIEKGKEVLIVDDLSNSRIEVLDGIEKIVGYRPEFLQVDLVNYSDTRQIFETLEINSIIHFAAKKAVGESVANPLLYYRNNLDSLINLLELSGEFRISDFIFSSSCTVYGEPDELPVTENSVVKKAESPYGNTKQIGEEIIQDFVKATEGFKAISLRYFNPIGAHESGSIGELPLGIPANLVPYITQTAAGIRNGLKIFGDNYNTSDGTCVRDYVHVADLAKAHVKALEFSNSMSEAYNYFNIGTGKGTTVLELVKEFEKVNEVKLNYEIVNRRSGDVEKTYADVTKAKDIMGWEAEYSLENMLASAWLWQKSVNFEA